MKVITLLSQKGGTGKTTLSIHLAVIASAKGINVVIADIDPQHSATVWKSRRSSVSPVVLGLAASELNNQLRQGKQQGVDLFIVDTAPHSHNDAVIAAEVADFIVIPSRPAILDLEAIGSSVAIVKEIKGRAAIVLNGCPFPGPSGERAIVSEAREALGGYDLPVAPVAISNRVALSHSLIDGRAVTEFENNGKAAYEVRALAQWLNKEARLW